MSNQGHPTGEDWVAYRVVIAPKSVVVKSDSGALRNYETLDMYILWKM